MPPAGLSLNESNGAIHGTPTAVAGLMQYEITGANTGGSVTTIVHIAVNADMPTGLAYHGATDAVNTTWTAGTSPLPSPAALHLAL